MAIIHEAEIVPGKLELLRGWVPRQRWAGGVDTSTLTALGAYRFDDPDGEVGVETHLLAAADGQVLQVPLTYRGAPLAGAGDALITTMTHSALGDRWVYDACYDPVYAAALAAAIFTGGREAQVSVVTESGPVAEAGTTHVRGSGSWPSAPALTSSGSTVRGQGTTTRVQAGVALSVLHVLGAAPGAGGGGLVLTGTWPGQESPLLLAAADPAP